MPKPPEVSFKSSRLFLRSSAVPRFSMWLRAGLQCRVLNGDEMRFDPPHFLGRLPFGPSPVFKLMIKFSSVAVSNISSKRMFSNEARIAVALDANFDLCHVPSTIGRPGDGCL